MDSKNSPTQSANSDSLANPSSSFLSPDNGKGDNQCVKLIDCHGHVDEPIIMILQGRVLLSVGYSDSARLA